MAGIQDFITSAAQNLGASEEQVSSATGGVLGFLKEKVDGGDFQSVLSQLPGASDVLGAASSGDGGSSGGGGLLGGIAQMAGSALGGKLGTMAGLLGAVQKSGLEAGKIDDFLGLFAGFAKNNLSGDLLGRILDQVPDLKKLVG